MVSEHSLADVTDAVADFDVGNGASNINDDAGSFVAKSFRVEASSEGSRFLTHN
jgi:hypothetical protein